MKLSILILTFDLHKKKLNVKNNTIKYMPRVCAKIGNKCLIEIAIENALRLDPGNIIIYVYKNNIEYINNVLKKKPYSKLLTYMFSETLKFEENNLLVIPGNYPFLSVKTLLRMIEYNKTLKIDNNLFFLKSDSLHLFEKVNEMHVTKDFIIHTNELKKIEKEKDLKII
jgi:bifunctional N-acetylglucosamine-1-phosphate-uridyltransferase/glucosamine-1-phosphate-acetyltransferase GlmU-like protein